MVRGTAGRAHMDIAVLGMGRMSGALAIRLLHGGHRLMVWNRTKGKAGQAVSDGAREAPSVADAVRDVDVVVTPCWPTTMPSEPSRTGIWRHRSMTRPSMSTAPRCRRLLTPSSPGPSPRASWPCPYLAAPTPCAGQAVYLAGGDGSVVDRLTPALRWLRASLRSGGRP